MTEKTFTPDWEWADELLAGSDWTELFEVDDCDFDPWTGNHNFFDEQGNCLVVTQDGDVLIYSMNEIF